MATMSSEVPWARSKVMSKKLVKVPVKNSVVGSGEMEGSLLGAALGSKDSEGSSLGSMDNDGSSLGSKLILGSSLGSREREGDWLGAGLDVGRVLGAREMVGVSEGIGEGAVVGARASVFKNVEPWTIVGGNPAKFIKKRELKNE